MDEATKREIELEEAEFQKALEDVGSDWYLPTPEFIEELRAYLGYDHPECNSMTDGQILKEFYSLTDWHTPTDMSEVYDALARCTVHDKLHYPPCDNHPYDLEKICFEFFIDPRRAITNAPFSISFDVVEENGVKRFAWLGNGRIVAFLIEAYFSGDIDAWLDGSFAENDILIDEDC